VNQKKIDNLLDKIKNENLKLEDKKELQIIMNETPEIVKDAINKIGVSKEEVKIMIRILNDSELKKDQLALKDKILQDKLELLHDLENLKNMSPEQKKELLLLQEQTKDIEMKLEKMKEQKILEEKLEKLKELENSKNLSPEQKEELKQIQN